MTSRSDRPPGLGDAVSRLVLGTVGTAVIVVALVKASDGPGSLAALPLVLVGAFLLLVCAFQRRIHGVLHWRDVDIPIDPPDRVGATGDATEPATPPPS